MTDEQSAGTPCVADNDLRQIVAGHGRRLDGLEDDVDTLKSGQRSMMDRLISIEAQGQERERNRAQESAQNRAAIATLSQQLAAQNGAQQERNRIEQQKLLQAQTDAARAQESEADANAAAAKIKYWIAIAGFLVGVITAVGGMLLSSQTWDDYAFGNVQFLHRKHPPTQPLPQPQTTQFILPPREMEVA
ncbi:hypothetical protein [Acetobacter pasteurianus]|uniref:Uncharacterized protein n=1 Tax=Acetobacter pasteurianus NBRC 3188 TaxID=1226663 RepID=A0A401WUN4_ACEPA|nr:hypothetical protein [Acetobacter pasteurianus]GCD53022.1 hypothetical protein NBRC3188_1719 [Acetobacter pasteurianus NBRC 3188]